MKLLLSYLLFITSAFAQIDTSAWFPMEIGNYWEYYDPSVQKSVSIIGDSVINGKKYFTFETIDFSEPDNKSIKFRRLENNSYLYELKNNSEILYYDFTFNEPTAWEITSEYFRAFVKVDTFITNMFLEPAERKEFENQYFNEDGHRIYFEREWQQVSKGVGETLIGYSGGYIELIGAIISGFKFGIVTSSKDNNVKPHSYSLNQNYPNPFNPITKIEFTIPEREYVELNVYNTIGQKVKTLLNEEILSGIHSVNFDGVNLPSGVYFYKIETKNYNKIKKMLLLK